MPEERNDRIYSADDIQRYLQGKMTRQEMYELEKASLDDEFLADAIEGYSLVAEEDHQKVLVELKESLVSKGNSSGKVVEMKKGGWKQWYRIAAALFFMLGSVAIVYRYVLKDKTEAQGTIALQKTTVEDSLKDIAAVSDSILLNNQQPSAAPVISLSEKTNTTELRKDTLKETVAKTGDVKDENLSTGYKADDKTVAAIVSNEPAKSETAPSAAKETESDLLNKKTVANDAAVSKNAGAANATLARSAAKDNDKENRAFINYSQNIFKGRVVNSKNEPLPFSKLSIKNDSFKIGTYADANGYFSFVALDTVLEVDAKSVGFTNHTVTLQKGLLAENKIVLEQNNQNLAEVVVTGYNAQRRKEIKQSKKDTSALTEPEDGWVNYDTYLSNNIEIPEKAKRKDIHGEVELSFDVNNKGEAQNIKVQKSLSKDLDQEAIRLVKEGPRWVPKKRKAKGKLIIRF